MQLSIPVPSSWAILPDEQMGGSVMTVPLGELAALRDWLGATTKELPASKPKMRRARKALKAKKVKGRTWTKEQREKFLATRTANLVAKQARDAQPALPMEAFA
jgi:hypothetical protein